MLQVFIEIRYHSVTLTDSMSIFPNQKDAVMKASIKMILLTVSIVPAFGIKAMKVISRAQEISPDPSEVLTYNLTFIMPECRNKDISLEGLDKLLCGAARCSGVK